MTVENKSNEKNLEVMLLKMESSLNEIKIKNQKLESEIQKMKLDYLKLERNLLMSMAMDQKKIHILITDILENDNNQKTN